MIEVITGRKNRQVIAHDLEKNVTKGRFVRPNIKKENIIMEQLKAFLEKARTDEELSEKIEALGEKAGNPDEIITLAAECGFTITAEEIEQLKSGNVNRTGSSEIAEEDLETIAGGNSKNRYDPNTCKNMTKIKDDCRGFLGLKWCDHYRQEAISYDQYGPIAWKHECVMDAFPNYKSYFHGKD